MRQKFTGYQKDEESGLDFAEARMYENRHGRFTAIDPLLASGKSANPQSFNRYVYVLNNPLIYTDPSGLQAGNYTGGSVYYTVLGDGRWAFSNRSGVSATSGIDYEKRYTGGPVRITGIDGYQYTVTSRGWRQHFLDIVAAERSLPPKKDVPNNQAPINNALLKDLGMRAPATHKYLFLLMAAGATGGLGAAPAVGMGGLVFGGTVVGEAMLAEQGIRHNAEAERDAAMMGSIESDRKFAVEQAWKQEAEMIRQTGRGTYPWTQSQINEILTNGRLEGFEGHHINSVNGHPELARDPNNIEFKTRQEHFEVHERNWRTITEGPLIRRPR